MIDELPGFKRCGKEKTDRPFFVLCQVPEPLREVFLRRIRRVPTGILDFVKVKPRYTLMFQEVLDSIKK
ncbi:MAG: hypothetical protein IKD58_04475 [Loktanella sp.]|nr:hypothetical protein [Loktanella sp.]